MKEDDVQAAFVRTSTEHRLQFALAVFTVDETGRFRGQFRKWFQK